MHRNLTIPRQGLSCLCRPGGVIENNETVRMVMLNGGTENKRHH